VVPVKLVIPFIDNLNKINVEILNFVESDT
ncbi:MAG: hypothetical protein XD43_1964, partial [Thermococcales archaeon 44_46]